MPFSLLIVNFHYFREATYRAGIYPVSKAGLEKQIDALSRSFTFCSQTDIVEWLAADTFPSGPYCLLTFDDGLREQMSAFELLRKKGIPAVFYVPVRPYLSESILSVHKLHYIRSRMSDRDLITILKQNPLFAAYQFDKALLAAQYRYDSDEARTIKFFFNFVLDAGEAGEVVGDIFSTLVSDQTSFRENLYMSREDLDTLSTYQMLGSHGCDHKPLATLSQDEYRKDIFDSLDFFKDAMGVPVRSFSYPYGSKAAVNSEVAQCLSSTSVRFAVTMFRGINNEADLRAQFMLKRVDTNDAPGGKNPLKALP